MNKHKQGDKYKNQVKAAQKNGKSVRLNSIDLAGHNATKQQATGTAAHK